MIDVATEAGRGAVIIRSRPLWQIRLLRGLPRYLLSALAAAGIVASARFAIAPPRPRLPAPAPVGPEPADRAAEGYAALFARRYLSWTGSEPLSSARALAPFAGAAMEADAGLRLPPSGEQHVEWVEVAPGVQGLWISGAPHVVFFFPEASPRLAGNVLVWATDTRTFRLEGRDLGRDDALRLAHEIMGTTKG